MPPVYGLRWALRRRQNSSAANLRRAGPIVR